MSCQLRHQTHRALLCPRLRGSLPRHQHSSRHQHQHEQCPCGTSKRAGCNVTVPHSTVSLWHIPREQDATSQMSRVQCPCATSCSVPVPHPAVSLCHIPNEQGTGLSHLRPLEYQVNPQGQAGTCTHFLSHITFFSPAEKLRPVPNLYNVSQTLNYILI